MTKSMMGYFVSVISSIGVVVFSISVFWSSDVLSVWLFLELASLCLIPSFIIGNLNKGDVFGSLFYYFVVSGISSGMIVVGAIVDGLWIVSLFGFLVKLGVFPVMWWVYYVVREVNWLVIWLLSTFLKFSVFLFPVFFSLPENGLLGLSVLISVMFVLLAALFWVTGYSDVSCWTHMMLASTALLIVVSFYGSFEDLLKLFAVYFFWSTLVILFFAYLSPRHSGWWYLYVVLLVSQPVSVYLLYKLVSVVCILSCPVWVILSWVVYSISEQAYLLVRLIRLGSSNLGSSCNF